MIPAALFAILAVARLGAIHAVVFGGFAPAALAQRIEASKAVAVLTASCGIEGTKGPISYKPFVQEAIQLSSHKPKKVLIWQREELQWSPIDQQRGEWHWQELMENARQRGLKAEAVPVNSDDGLYIIYTSGTTGTPKGVLRPAAGHAVGLNLSIKYLFGISAGDTIFTASDIGWVVGHSYILYAPLLAGATTVLFEGKPVGTPDAGVFWRIVSDHNVNILFCAPTALRAIRKDDAESNLFKAIGEKGGLRGLRGLFLAGERSEPGIVSMYLDLLGKYAAPGAMVVDNWWSSESGSPISGIAMRPTAGKDLTSEEVCEPLPVKAGAAGKPMPGFDVRVVDDEGNEVSKKGEMGNLVLAIPLAPTGFTTLFQDEARYYKGYLHRFNGRWIDTGDAGMIDEEGYVHVMSRSDDVINVAAHRFSTGQSANYILPIPLPSDISLLCMK
ncbi:MAG: hypothetical protein Q9220_004653 [cf. Caloplaca sp. 1 TL-2023]